MNTNPKLTTDQTNEQQARKLTDYWDNVIRHLTIQQRKEIRQQFVEALDAAEARERERVVALLGQERWRIPTSAYRRLLETICQRQRKEGIDNATARSIS